MSDSQTRRIGVLVRKAKDVLKPDKPLVTESRPASPLPDYITEDLRKPKEG